MQTEKWVVNNEAVYPTLPSTYAYNNGSPHSRREGFYQPHPPPVRQHSGPPGPYGTYDPRYH